MDAPAAAQPVSRLCPACFFCFPWKLAPDKSAALQTEQKQEGSSPQVSYYCPKAAHSHTWTGQHQGCCHSWELWSSPSVSLADSQQHSARQESNCPGPGLSFTPFLADWREFSYEEDRETPVPQPKLSLCLFLCVSVTSVEATLNDVGAACGTTVLGLGCAVAGSSPFSPCWLRRWSSVTTQSWGLAQEGSAGSCRPAVTGSSLSSVGSFPSETHWFSTELLICEALKMSSVEDCKLGPPITLLKFVFISPY